MLVHSLGSGLGPRGDLPRACTRWSGMVRDRVPGHSSEASSRGRALNCLPASFNGRRVGEAVRQESENRHTDVPVLKLKSFGGPTLERDGRVLTGAASRRRPLALLALLASYRDRRLSRDKAVAYFWPEGDAERSRHALAQTLYSIRHDLGSDVVLAGTSDLQLNPALIEVDIWDFETALA